MAEEQLIYRDADVEMVYTRTEGEGRAFVLVHGIGMGKRVFEGLAELLALRGPVIAIDQPGFGDSPEPAAARSMAAMGDLVADFVAHLGLEDPVLIGHSMGTQVVAEAVARHPGLSSQIVLIAPTVNSAERSASRQTWRLLQDLRGESPKVLALGAWQYAKAGPRWFVRKMKIMLEHPAEEIYPRIQAETLVLRGEDDKVCPREWVRYVAGLIPRSRYDEVPAHGHEAMIRDPADVARLILAFVR